MGRPFPKCLLDSNAASTVRQCSLVIVIQPSRCRAYDLIPNHQRSFLPASHHRLSLIAFSKVEGLGRMMPPEVFAAVFVGNGPWIPQPTKTNP